MEWSDMMGLGFNTLITAHRVKPSDLRGIKVLNIRWAPYTQILTWSTEQFVKKPQYSFCGFDRKPTVGDSLHWTPALKKSTLQTTVPTCAMCFAWCNDSATSKILSIYPSHAEIAGISDHTESGSNLDFTWVYCYSLFVRFVVSFWQVGQLRLI